MLRDVSLLILTGDAGLMLAVGQKWSAALFACAAFVTFTKKRTYSHVINKELNFISAQILRISLGVFVITMLAIWLTPLGANKYLPLFASISLVTLPFITPLVISHKLAKSDTEISQFRQIRILRSVFGLSVAFVLFIIAGQLGLMTFGVQPPVNLNQIFVIQAALILPFYCLKYDKKSHKLLRVNAHNLKNNTLSKKTLWSYVGYGLSASLTAYAAYLFVFLRYRLSPLHIDPSLPLHMQASSVAVATFIVCICLGIMFERVDKHEYFINQHTLENQKLLKSFLAPLAIISASIYTPHLKDVFGFEGMTIFDSVSVIAFACIYISIRMTRRHLRKHSRHAVVKLHNQLNS